MQIKNCTDIVSHIKFAAQLIITVKLYTSDNKLHSKLNGAYWVIQKHEIAK